MSEELKEDVNEDERNMLFYELVLRQSAVETLLLKKNIFTEQELAESQVECMAKLEAVLNAKNNDQVTNGE